ncbi:MAG: 30S ribosomal protein S4 [Candidatus Woesebacteria bacterium GW2011_GWA1_39_21b]|uniref:Small ribosomal subunit protein uS4 n=3 Tax=Patescibacteria group TaxID=1783273 RepID=A0A1G2QFS3_9BACT|nr:MAG: 30S ribosomal protein S4 [Candidatus Woesebacteria bacterium GW2011_GWA1_39_21b]KKS77204.1 MAG: 30S ribosomal protein S4 [Parcubacteria group bacterium GW2011_GWB1_42_9]KKS89777.1 MAG: 30S ribosomal protein S4 [Parcubacteria group bacterium GW2011_GWC1_43_11b]OHA59347.1 MAG: hypothetical protein A2370_00155 [Candidatus Vogelbacteria bacterium RIFOXYB1_FULL_42_16]OHA60268.1 MAG: hypothetical protein A2607_01280 [Candidatus Vogelbacteria bacterium RIFOXYD1_FULL_42_15]
MQIGPRYKICRRLGDRVFSKCQTTKFTVSGTDKKTVSKKGRRGASEYGQQLLEKQKARYAYGVSEKQFSNYVKNARSLKGGNPTLELFKQLESRLDNIVFRLGLVNSRLSARQVVSHGHILVNGRKTTIPSTAIRRGDVIQIRPGSREIGPFRTLAERAKDYTAPDWLIYDIDKNEGLIKGEPVYGQSEANLKFGSILEYYSRV